MGLKSTSTAASPDKTEQPGRDRRCTVAVWTLGLYAAWTVVWLVYEGLARTLWPNLRDSVLEQTWWLVAKLLVWIVPVVALVRRWRVGSVASWLGLDQANGLGRGLVLGAIWLVVSVVIDWLVPGRWPEPGPPVSALFLPTSMTVLAVVLEEILYRGFALRALVESGLSFWRANLTAAILFALLHVPGWLFMARQPGAIAATMPSVVLLGLVCGIARKRNASLWGSVVVHAINNLWSGGLLLNLVRRVAILGMTSH